MITLSLGFMLISILTVQQFIYHEQNNKPGSVKTVAYDDFRNSVFTSAMMCSVISIGYAITFDMNSANPI